jgi:hypothetical protein
MFSKFRCIHALCHTPTNENGKTEKFKPQNIIGAMRIAIHQNCNHPKIGSIRNEVRPSSKAAKVWRGGVRIVWVSIKMIFCVDYYI